MNLIRRSNHKELWDPLGTLTDLQEEMNKLFASSIKGRSGTALTDFFTPAIDLTEDEQQYKIVADLPGISKEDLDISVTGNRMVIKGERKEETEKKEKGFSYSERWAGSFRREIELPSEVDSSKIKASFNSGVLEILVPKAESAKPKQIKVEVK